MNKWKWINVKISGQKDRLTDVWVAGLQWIKDRWADEQIDK